MAGSGAAAAWWLASGRRVRSKACGHLGVVSPVGDDDDGAAVQRTVRLADGQRRELRPEELEPWTRGVRVRLRSSGQRGELVRVLQLTPPAERPYLVRLADGSTDWLRCAEVRFEPLERRGSSLASEAARREAEQCAVTLVPGRWTLSRPLGPASVALTCTRRGCAVRGTGEDSLGAFEFIGEERRGVLKAQLDYVSSVRAREEVATRGVGALDGAWCIEDSSPKRSWAAVEAGVARVAGCRAGCFQTSGASFKFVKTESGQSLRAILHGADLLCLGDGSTWWRLDQEEFADVGAVTDGTKLFDPPKKSEQGEAGDGECCVQRLTQTPEVLRIKFEATASAVLPDVLKTELSVDGRIVEASRADIKAALSKKKKFRSTMEGEVLFDDVCLCEGSAVRLRFGGQYAGYSWAELLSAPDALSCLMSKRSCSTNPLRQQHLEGSVADDGLKVDGFLGEGPTVTVSGKSAKAIKVSRAGRVTTVSLRPYDNEDLAKIEIRGPAKVHFTFFQTEATYDCLEIAGTEYSGSERPPSYFIPEGQRTVMAWKSDESTTDEGWEFVVTSCSSYLQLGERELEFGACEAPWNEAGALSRASVPVRRISGGAAALDDDECPDVSGHILLQCSEPEPEACAAEGEGEGEGAAGAPLDEASTFGPALLELVRRAERAGARGVVVAAPTAARGGALQLAAAEPPQADAEDPAGEWPSIPAVLVGREVAEQVAAALARGEHATVGPRAGGFSMVLEAPAALDGSRELAELCLGSPNVLRAVLGASAAGGAAEASAAAEAAGAAGAAVAAGAPSCAAGPAEVLAARLREHAGAIASEAALPARATAAGDGDAAAPGDAAEDGHVRELLRSLLPPKLPTAALLPCPERGERSGRVWDFYCKGRGLGAGSFGVVRQAWDRFLGGYVAVKKIKLKDEGNIDKDDVLREFGLLRDLSHPNLLRVLDIFAAGKKLYLVTEYSGAGDLTRYVASKGKIDEPWIAGVMRQVLSACRCLHSHKIVHHDIKPANVLVTSHRLDTPEAAVPLVLVADFGLAQAERFVDQEAREQAGAGNGTSYYMAPESAKGLSGPKTDVYAVGVMAFELLSGGECPDAVGDDGEPPGADWDLLAHCSSAAVDVAKALMEPAVGLRLTCEAALALGWFWPRSRGDSGADGAEGRGSAAAGAAAAEAAAAADAAGRLRRHAGRDFLQRALLRLLVEQLGRAELEEARRAFLAVDADGDGWVSERDLAQALGEGEGGGPSAGALLAALDLHGGGSLDFGAFAAAHVDLHGLPEILASGVVEKVFRQLGGSGAAAGALDLPALLARFGCADEGGAEVLAGLFHRYNVAGDGRLTREEFFGILGLACPSTCAPQLPPARMEGPVTVLRGSEKEASVEGCFVECWTFATLGQPRLGQTRGRWYYEFSILKCEYPQIGWADSDFEFDDRANDDGVGDDEHSWGIDGVRQLKWSDGSEPWGDLWPLPAVIGCAVDLDEAREMTFSVDGQWEAEPAFKGFSFRGALYPAISGVLVGRFHFAPHECRYQPPGPGYRHLGSDTDARVPRPLRPASP